MKIRDILPNQWIWRLDGSPYKKAQFILHCPWLNGQDIACLLDRRGSKRKKAWSLALISKQAIAIHLVFEGIIIVIVIITITTTCIKKEDERKLVHGRWWTPHFGPTRMGSCSSSFPYSKLWSEGGKWWPSALFPILIQPTGSVIANDHGLFELLLQGGSLGKYEGQRGKRSCQMWAGHGLSSSAVHCQVQDSFVSSCALQPSVMWLNLSWGDGTHRPTHPRYGSREIPKYRYHQSSTW